MKKHMKRKGMAAAAALLSICMAFPGLAGQWNQDENGKWYERDDGTYIQTTGSRTRTGSGIISMRTAMQRPGW